MGTIQSSHPKPSKFLWTISLWLKILNGIISLLLAFTGIELVVLFYNIALNALKNPHTSPGTLDSLRRLIATLIFYSWSLGSAIDYKNIKNVFIKAPKPNQKQICIIVISVVIPFMIILSSIIANSTFLMLLGLFLLQLGTVVMREKVERFLVAPVVKLNYKEALRSQDFLLARSLKVLRFNMSGKWQIVRLYVCNIVSALALIIYVVGILIAEKSPAYNLNAHNLIFSFFPLIFLIGIDSWMWYQRSKAFLLIRELRSLGEKYKLVKEEAPLKE
jgi:hypothetical protein